MTRELLEALEAAFPDIAEGRETPDEFMARVRPGYRAEQPTIPDRGDPSERDTLPAPPPESMVVVVSCGDREERLSFPVSYEAREVGDCVAAVVVRMRRPA